LLESKEVEKETKMEKESAGEEEKKNDYHMLYLI